MKWVPLFLLLLAGVACAQESQGVSRDESETEGMKRILHPALNPAVALQDRTFYGGTDKGFSTKKGNVKAFQWANLFRIKTYAGARAYGAKDYWTGNYEAGGKLAATQGNYTIPNATTQAAVKTNPVKDDREAGKTQETRDYEKNRPFLVPGKSQKILDSQQAVQTPLTVDDVRKLLNTTR